MVGWQHVCTASQSILYGFEIHRNKIIIVSKISLMIKRGDLRVNRKNKE